MTSILLADDHSAVRVGLRLLLESAGFTVLGEAADGATAVAMARALRPDVVLMDVRMPGMDGIEATRLIVTGGHSRVLVVTTFELDEYVAGAVAAGAAGYVLKTAEADALAAAVREVAAGRGFVDPSVVPTLLRQAAAGVDQGHAARADDGGSGQASSGTAWPPHGLSERELDVLRRIGEGLSNRLIASDLGLAETTVKTHVSNALAKLGLRSRVQAALWWSEHAPPD